MKREASGNIRAAKIAHRLLATGLNNSQHARLRYNPHDHHNPKCWFRTPKEFHDLHLRLTNPPK